MERIAIRITVAMSILALVLVEAWAQSTADEYPYWHHMMWWNGGWYGMFFGPLFMLLGLAAVVALVVIFIRSLAGAAPSSSMPPARTALDILKERFARGEIDKDEYEERRRILDA